MRKNIILSIGGIFFEGVNLYDKNKYVKRLAEKYELDSFTEQFRDYGIPIGSGEWIHKAKQANDHLPRFYSHDTKLGYQFGCIADIEPANGIMDWNQFD